MKNKEGVQIVGSQADLDKSPHNQVLDSFAGGTVQMIGSEAELSHKTTPMGEFNKGIKGGRVDMVGSMTELNRAEHRGYESWETPLADASYNPTGTKNSYPK